jgi:hypothetical protein
VAGGDSGEPARWVDGFMCGRWRARSWLILPVTA